MQILINDLGHKALTLASPKMEIYAEVKNFSFYENNSTFYINGRVIEKRILPGSHPFQAKFEEVKVGEVAELKVTKARLEELGITTIEKLAVVLLNPFLIFEIENWEAAAASFKKSSPKFLIKNARTCDIFRER